MSRFRHNPYTFYVIAGLCTGAAFVYPFLWWLGMVGVVVFVRALVMSTQRRAHARGAVLTGLIHAGFVLSWLFTTTQPIYFTESSTLFYLLLTGYWFLSAAVFGIGMMFTGILFFHLRSTHSLHYALWTLPLGWVAGNIIGSLLFSALYLGPGSTLSLNFTYGYLGYLPPVSPHLAIAFSGSVYFATALYVFLGGALYSIITTARHRARIILAAASIIIIILLLKPAADSSHFPEPLHIASINTFFPSHSLTAEEKHEHYLDALIAASVHNPDYIILPEDSRFRRGFPDDEALLGWLVSVFGTDITLIDSDTVQGREQNTRELHAFIYTTADMSVRSTGKTYLTPSGEYVPYIHNALAKLILSPDSHQHMRTIAAYRPSTNTQPSDILFCLESAVPFAHTPTTDLPFLPHIVSHGWFDTPDSLWYQQDMMLRLQAVIHQTPIITATNQSHSAYYTAAGSLVPPSITIEQGLWRIDMYEL